MNIELVKQEIEKLATLLSSWEEGKPVSAIERDLALSKLTKLYELIRFDAEPATGADILPPIMAPITDEPMADISKDTAPSVDETTEQEIEVEIIFADEEEEENDEEIINLEDTTEEEIAKEEISLPDEVETQEEVVFIAQEEITNTPELEVEPQKEPEQIINSEPVVKPEPVQDTQPEKQPKSTSKPTMESLFGAEEIQRKPRSKHQRMMALYGEAQPKQEKAVDISKIFDMEDDDIFEIKVSANEATQESAPKQATPIITDEVTTLADAIATQQTTLADTIVAPTALAEEITNSKITSLRQAIGINDKFLMIRDLFDGDDEAYDEAIAALDELSSLEDCMIHIIENYEWNPDVEGSKFIMQLLERKFS